MNIETDKPVEITIATAPQTLTFEGETQPFMTIGAPEIKINSDHQDLKNLDYENSGHTGFQPAGNYVEDNNYVHTDNNFTNENKTKLDGLENFSGNATDVNYEDNYGEDIVKRYTEGSYSYFVDATTGEIIGGHTLDYIYSASR